MGAPTDEQHTEPEQQTAATTEEDPSAVIAFLEKPVFGGASILQLTLLLAIGTIWSGAIWLTVDRIKDGLGMEKPYTKRERMWLTFGPLLASILLCLAAFPAALSLAGVPFSMDPPWAVLGIAAGCGVVAWAAAKVAHDFWGEVFTAARQSLVNRIRKLGGEKVRGYTTDSAAVKPDDDKQ